MKKTTLMILALLFTISAFAEKQTPPTPGAPHNFEIPPIRRFDLPNGVKVRLVSYGEVPKATVRLVTQTGNVDEGENEVWLADVTGSMIEQGTATRSAEQIAREVAMMGGALEVNVGLNQTTIATDVFSESAAQAVRLVSDVVRNPRLPESELARIKANFARRLSIQRSQPGQLAAEKFAQVLYGKHAYGRMFPTEPMLQAYSAEQVRSFYDRNFGGARTFVYVVGRFDADAVESAIRQTLGDWKAGNAPTKPVVPTTARRGIYLIDRPGSVQSTLSIGLPLADATAPDYLALTVMNSLLGGAFTSHPRLPLTTR
jgi:predicted Zn-dependent peptidase